MTHNPFRQGRRIVTPVALAAVSLVSAIALWIVVTESQNPSRTETFGAAIQVTAVNVPNGQAVFTIQQSAVTVRVSGPDSILKRLTSADFRAEVDLAGVLPKVSDQRVVARVVGKKDVGVVDVSPAFVTVTLEPLTSKQVPVRARPIGSLPQGFALTGDPEMTPAQVRVSGAESAVQSVAEADADVNLTGLRVPIKQSYALTPRDARGADITGVKVEPASADIRMPIAQQEVTLTLTIQPTLQGSVADGYNLAGTSTDPPAIAVSGPLEVLQAVSTLTTDPIDLSGLRSDTVRTVRLRTPSSLVSTRDTVSIRLHVVPAQGEMTLALAPQITSLGEGLKATILTSSVTVRLSGDLPTLRALQPGAVKVTASVSGLSEGIQVVKVTVSVPDNVQVTATDPQQVVVNLQK